MKANCIFFAVRLWWRRGCRGYLMLRRSRVARKAPHLLYAEARPYGLRVVSWVPVVAAEKKVPPLCFEGKVRWGDL